MTDVIVEKAARTKTREAVMKHTARAGHDAVFKVDKWTRTQWAKHIVSDDPTGQWSQLSSRGCAAEVFAREVFARLFTGDMLEPLPYVTTEHAWMQAAHAMLSALSDFQRLLLTSTGDRFLSASNALELATSISGQLPQQLERHSLDQLRRQYKSLIEEGKRLRAAAEVARLTAAALAAQPPEATPAPEQPAEERPAEEAQAETQPEETPPPGPAAEAVAHMQSAAADVAAAARLMPASAPDADALEQQAAAAEEQAAAVKQEGAEAAARVQAWTASIDTTAARRALRTAAADLADAQASMDESMATFGWGSGAGSAGASTVGKAKHELAKALRGSEKLRKLAALAGRMVRTAEVKQRSKADYMRSEVADIELGSDLARVLPSELAKLGDPALKLDFFRRFIEGGLMQYRLTGREAQAKGPIVICLDSSGSMAGPPELWSKAVALAMLYIAGKQRRHCLILHFTQHVMQVNDYPPGQADPAQVARDIENFYDGGTSFEAPLNAARAAIETGGMSKADVVLITDGVCDVRAEWMEDWTRFCTQHSVSVYAVAIGVGELAPGAPLVRLATSVTAIDSIADDASVQQTLFSI